MVIQLCLPTVAYPIILPCLKPRVKWQTCSCYTKYKTVFIYDQTYFSFTVTKAHSLVHSQICFRGPASAIQRFSLKEIKGGPGGVLSHA